MPDGANHRAASGEMPAESFRQAAVCVSAGPKGGVMPRPAHVMAEDMRAQCRRSCALLRRVAIVDAGGDPACPYPASDKHKGSTASAHTAIALAGAGTGNGELLFMDLLQPEIPGE